MKVSLKDGSCRVCGGELTIVNADDSALEVECECGESYLVATDAFNDGGMTYYVGFLSEQMKCDDAT
ncbi:MAG: hypothetical protein HY289_01125 [Planctomycetes bacterium]|nr:hypothetical protein [Planctomycetota bacterium]